jgi:hypothetical protein
MTNRNRKPRHRAARRLALKARGIKAANRQRVWGVRLKRTVPISEYSQMSIEALSVANNRIWLTPRYAKRLMNLGVTDRSDVIRTEFKRCLLCNRPCIGTEAAEYRRALESAKDREDVRCGPRCFREQVSGIWHTLSRLSDLSESA